MNENKKMTDELTNERMDELRKRLVRIGMIMGAVLLVLIFSAVAWCMMGPEDEGTTRMVGRPGVTQEL